MKRILYIAPHDLNKRTGGSLATLAYLNALLSLYGDIVDIMMPEEANNNTFHNVIPVKARSHVKALLSGSLHRYRAAVREHLAGHAGDYGVCVINGGLYAGDMMDMLHGYGLKIMVIHHNFEREYALDNKGLLTLFGRTSYFIVKNERRAYLRANVNCFLTQEDMVLFKTHYGESAARSYLLGVFEPQDVELPRSESHRKKNIAITGSMNSVQTMCGISDIHNNYYDIIRDLCPEWNLIIAGRSPRSEVYELQRDNPLHIQVIPNPPVMDDVVRKASIFLCPTNVGGGLKLRLMDGLRMGLPILVHKVSARGYEAFANKPYFKVYHDRESFKKGLNDILVYCSENHDGALIQDDYLMNFSFGAGCRRMSEAMAIIGED